MERSTCTSPPWRPEWSDRGYSSWTGFTYQACGILFEAARLVSIQKLLRAFCGRNVDLAEAPLRRDEDGPARLALLLCTRTFHAVAFPTLSPAAGLRRAQRRANTLLRRLGALRPGHGPTRRLCPPIERLMRFRTEHRRRFPDRVREQSGADAFWVRASFRRTEKPERVAWYSVLKDILLVVGSVILLGSTVTFTQLIGCVATLAFVSP
jgi:hypothetical protein